MGSARVAFDHVHVISRDPEASVSWFVEKLGGERAEGAEVRGAPQIPVRLGGATVMVRGERTGERAAGKSGLQWGTDHFAFRVEGDFQGFCDDLKAKGVKFTMEPRQFNPTTRIAFIEAPDGVSIELLSRA